MSVGKLSPVGENMMRNYQKKVEKLEKDPIRQFCKESAGTASLALIGANIAAMGISRAKVEKNAPFKDIIKGIPHVFGGVKKYSILSAGTIAAAVALGTGLGLLFKACVNQSTKQFNAQKENQQNEKVESFKVEKTENNQEADFDRPVDVSEVMGLINKNFF